MSSTATLEPLVALCAEVGFELERVTAPVIARLSLLGERTETMLDCERMLGNARDLFRYYDQAKPSQAFSDGERRIVVLGCIFSDIGKTGPGNADASGQRLLVELFAVEGVRDETQHVAQFCKAYFPADADDRVRRFAALGLDPGMPIRELWNLHSTWTLEILEAGAVPAEVIAAAATHHLLDDINPGEIVAPDRHFTRASGDNLKFDRAEKLIIVLDKYDAVRRRGRRPHDQAITWLRERVDKNPRFRDDEEFLTLIADLDAMLRS